MLETTLMPVHGWLLPPRLWKQFRERMGHLFKPSLAVVTTLTETRWRGMIAVTNDINMSVQYDASRVGEPWAIATKRAACVGIALRKREELVKLRFPRACLHLVFCRTKGGEDHAVLAVDTDKGTFILDNRKSGIWEWNILDYKWLGREPAPGRFFWLRIGAS